MLVLCSNGLSSKALLDYIRPKTVSCKTAALVVTADNIYKEKNYHVSRCTQELEALDLTVDLFDLDLQAAELLHKYDVVEFIGGNPFYLLHTIQKYHATNILKTIATEKILIGWSAAAFVFGPSLELVNSYSPEMNFLQLTDLTALALTETEVLPHYKKFITKYPQFEEKCQCYENAHHVNVLRLNDGDGVFIDQSGPVLIRA